MSMSGALPLPPGPVAAGPVPPCPNIPATTMPRFSELPVKIRLRIWKIVLRLPHLKSGTLPPNAPGIMAEWAVPLYTGDDWFIGVQPGLLHTRVRPSVSQACREARYAARKKMGVSQKRQKDDIRLWETDIPFSASHGTLTIWTIPLATLGGEKIKLSSSTWKPSKNMRCPR